MKPRFSRTAIVVGTVLVLAVGAAIVAVKVSFYSSAKEDAHFQADYRHFQNLPSGLFVLRPTHFRTPTDGLDYSAETSSPSGEHVTWMMGRNRSFRQLVARIYNCSPYQVVLPPNAPTERFDYLFTILDNRARERFEAAIRKLGYVASWKEQDTEVLLLKVQKPGTPGLKPATSPNKSRLKWNSQNQLEFRNLGMASLVNEIESWGNVPVVDETGLSMAYDFDLNCSKNALANRDWDSINEALGQLGLVLIPTNMPKKVLVVDKANVKDLGDVETSSGTPIQRDLLANSLKSDYIGQKSFPQGDSIEITSVERSTNQMMVKGHYSLVSHEQALLALYCTSTNRNPHEDASQRMQISRGRGDFELSRSHLYPGFHHVSMYAPWPDGKPFAALYFGTKEEALEESKAQWITNRTVAPIDHITGRPTSVVPNTGQLIIPGSTPVEVIGERQGLAVTSLSNELWEAHVAFRNRGSVASPAFSLLFYAGASPRNGRLISRNTAGPIPAGGTFCESTGPFVLRTKETELCAVIDPENVLQRPAESAEWILQSPLPESPAAEAERKAKAEIARLKLQSAEEEVKTAETRFAIGTLSAYDLQKVKWARDIAAAEARDDNVEVARLKLQICDLDLDSATKRLAVGKATQQEYQNAKLARDAAAIYFQELQKAEQR